MLYPVYQPFSGQVDATGKASIPISGLQTAAWASVFATVEQSVNQNGILTPVGNPSWSLQIDQNKAAYGTGSTTEIGPRLVPPKSKITINLSNGNAGAVVTGILQGHYSTLPDASEIMVNHKPNINPISINTSPAPLEVTIATGPINSGFTNNFQALLTGTTYLVTAVALSGPTTLTIAGPSGIQYYQETFINQYGVFPFGQLFIVRLIPVDPLLDTALTLDNLGPGNVLALNVSAHTDPVPAEATSLQGPLYTFPIAATSIAANGVLPVILAPTNQNTVWNLENFSLFQDGANAAGRITIQDTSTPTPAIIHDMFCNNTRGLLDRGSLGGVAVKSGQGVNIQNFGAAASFIGGYLSARSLQLWAKGLSSD